MKQIESDDLPAVGESVLVVCDGFRCLGHRDATGNWIDGIQGRALENVLGYYTLS